MAASSQLVEILGKVAALSVGVTDPIGYSGEAVANVVTPRALYLATLPQNAAEAKLPARLIRLMRQLQGGGRAYAFAFGNENVARVTWRIYDLLLWRSLDAGQGIGSHEADLAKYAAAYADALRLLVGDGLTARARLVGAEITVDQFEYPEGSGNFYAGVEAALDIEERLVGTNPAAFG